MSAAKSEDLLHVDRSAKPAQSCTSCPAGYTIYDSEGVFGQVSIESGQPRGPTNMGRIEVRGLRGCQQRRWAMIIDQLCAARGRPSRALGQRGNSRTFNPRSSITCVRPGHVPGSGAVVRWPESPSTANCASPVERRHSFLGSAGTTPPHEGRTACSPGVHLLMHWSKGRKRSYAAAATCRCADDGQHSFVPTKLRRS